MLEVVSNDVTEEEFAVNTTNVATNVVGNLPNELDANEVCEPEDVDEEQVDVDIVMEEVLRITEDGSVVCSCRHFLRYGLLCRHIFCLFKNRDVNAIPKQYTLRRWTRNIIPSRLRRQRNRYGEKNLTLESLANEANFLVDDTLFLVNNDEKRMRCYVEQLRKILDDLKLDMPNAPSRSTLEVIADIYKISKPDEVLVNNPTKAINKGEHVNTGEPLKKGQRLKSQREKTIKVRWKAMKVCGYCKEKTNEHTKTTCPKNPKARKKKKATPILDV